jgi:hypothetical protein
MNRRITEDLQIVSRDFETKFEFNLIVLLLKGARIASLV